LTSENEKEIAARKLDNAATVARTRDRMSKLTWETLLSNALFDDWSAPKAIVGAARDKIQETCRAMRDLGPKPRRAEVRAILKAAVQWFNEANLEAGGVIDTIAREDICRVLEDILFVARQPALADEIDGWRDW
jgi:hypothetical protein